MSQDSKCHIARISYGKDSLKMLEVIWSRGLPLDRITTTDVWATDTIPANLPPIQAFKDRMDQRIWDMYRIEVEHLCATNKDGSKKTYEQMFYHIPKRRSQIVQVERDSSRERSKAFQTCGIRGAKLDSNGFPMHRLDGSITGFPPNTAYNWCQKLKIPNTGISSTNIAVVQKTQNRQSQNPFLDGPTTRGSKTNIVEYLGIASDEPKRFGQLNERKRAPLVEFGIDEDMCGLYCTYADMLSPTYETSYRDGCWFCHNQGVDQLRLLRKNYPDLWALLLKWDKDSPVAFKADGHTVCDFDVRFQMEEENKVPVGRSFRWSMLETPPKFVATTGDQLTIF